jgi:hypothetical protein
MISSPHSPDSRDGSNDIHPSFYAKRQQRRISLDCTAQPVDDMTSHLGKLEYPE